MSKYRYIPNERRFYFLVLSIWGLTTFVEIILFARLVLGLVNSRFAAPRSLIYVFSQPMVAPFLKILGVSGTQSIGLPWTITLAMSGYWMLTWIIVRLLFAAKISATSIQDA